MCGAHPEVGVKTLGLDVFLVENLPAKIAEVKSEMGQCVNVKGGIA